MPIDPETEYAALEGETCRWWELALVALYVAGLYLVSLFRKDT